MSSSPSARTHPPQPKLLLLDVGNVLVELCPFEALFAAAIERGLEGGRRLHDPEAAFESFRGSETISRFARGLATVDEFFASVRAHFEADWPDEAIRRIYMARLGPPVAGMTELIRDARAAGLRVAGFSNTTPIHIEILVAMPIIGLLERLVTSVEIGAEKPAPESYERALELLAARPEETFFADDRDENIEGARAAGLRASVFRGAEALRAELGLARRS